MRSLIAFIKKEIVFCVALVCAAVSAIFIPPSKAYLSYIDWNTLLILFALMGVIAAFRSCGLFDRLGTMLCARFHSVRALSAVLVALCFFTSMFITNDVALLTFVPFTITLLAPVATGNTVMYTVILQTIAANCGSMLTPLGNPQNLFLFQQMNLPLKDFIAVPLPFTLISAVSLALALLAVPKKAVSVQSVWKSSSSSHTKEIIYAILFLLCLLSVLRFIPKYVAALSVLVVLLIVNRKALLQIDYMLLLTFCAFFIFTGNIGSAPQIKQMLTDIVSGHEFISAVASSQIISNVPATLLLFPFTQDTRSLLAGVNAGGLGTLVASLASLISYKLYAQAADEQQLPSGKKYLALFTVCNVVMLALLCAYALLFWK
ncbi:MAG: anion permease [Treponema sp.]|nr:anion permease [Treponema sp.]